MKRLSALLLILASIVSGQDNLTRRSSQSPKPNFWFGGLINVSWNSDPDDPSQTWHTTGTSPITSNSLYRGVVQAQYSRGLVVQLAYPWDVERTQGVFTYTSPDEVADWATARGIHAHAHVLAWGVKNADVLAAAPWYYSLANSAAVDSAMTNHVTNVVGHFASKYPGYVKFWDLANEMMPDTTPAQLNTAGYINWLTGVDDVLVDAPGLTHTGTGASYSPTGLWALFAACHAADPTALCGYNDYGLELEATNTGKMANVLNLILTAQRDGAVIDYIGMQTHRAHDDSYSTTTVGGIRTIDQFNTNCNALGTLGVKCALTELDVTVPTSPSGPDLTAQGIVYGDFVRTCLWNSNCIFVTHWGISDKDSWQTANHPTLFDDSYVAKSVFTTVLNVFPPPRIFPMPGGVVR